MKVAIVGAGVSGLAAGFRIRERDPGVELRIFEASDAPGGALKTTREHGFCVDRGPDSILSSKPAARSLVRRLGIEERVITTKARGAYVVHRGALQRIPAGFALLAPTSWQALDASPLLSRSAKLRARFDRILPRGKASAEGRDESLASFVRRRFGTELFERLAQPLAGGIYAADPELLSLRSTLPRFLEHEARRGSVSSAIAEQSRASGAPTKSEAGARYGLFFSFDSGMGVLTEALAEHLGDAIRTNTPVTSLDPAVGEINGERFDHVILAVSSNVASKLLAAADPVLASRLRSIPLGSAATIEFAFDGDAIDHPFDAAGFVVPSVERRLMLASTWCSTKWAGRAPAGKQLIRVFLGGYGVRGLAAWSDEELVKVALREFGEVMKVRKQPTHQWVDRYMSAMPQFTLGHPTRKTSIRAALSAWPRLHLAGNYLDGVGIPDAIDAGERAADAALQRG